MVNLFPHFIEAYSLFGTKHHFALEDNPFPIIPSNLICTLTKTLPFPSPETSRVVAILHHSADGKNKIDPSSEDWFSSPYSCPLES